MTDPVRWPLRTIFWEATLRCNARCEFCGSRCGETETAGELTCEEALGAFRQIASAYDPARIMLHVTGGEPLLRNDLFDIMAQAAELGFSWGMVTNGSLIVKETVQRMRASGMKTVSISLDGMKARHEAIRRLPGGFEKIVRGIELLKEAAFLDELQVTTVVNRENLAELGEMHALLTSLGVDSWRLALVDPIGRAQDNARLLLTKEDLQKYFDFFDRRQFDGPLRLTTSCSHFLGERDNLYRPQRFACQAGKSIMSILANGDIFVCPNVERRKELIQGNVRTDSIPEIWENGFRFFRNADARRVGPCRDCADWEICLGDSLHTWDFDARRPKFCIREAEGIPAAPAALPRSVMESLRANYSALTGIQISYGSASHQRVYFSPAASEELDHAFFWGRRHPRNRFELMAALIGHRYEGCALVEFVVPVPLARRDLEEAAFSEVSFRTALEELDIINRCSDDSDPLYRLDERPFELLGLAHTHPNDLPPVMSEPDMALFSKLRRENGLMLFMILNPHKKDICAYWDSVHMPTDVELFCDGPDAEKWQ